MGVATKMWILVLAAAGGAALWLFTTGEEPVLEPLAAESSPGQGVPERLSEPPATDEVVLVYDVEGMCCGGCPARLHAALVELEEVREAAVSFESGTASVRVSADADAEAIAAVLRFDKYDAALRP